MLTKSSPKKKKKLFLPGPISEDWSNLLENKNKMLGFDFKIDVSSEIKNLLISCSLSFFPITHTTEQPIDTLTQTNRMLKSFFV